MICLNTNGRDRTPSDSPKGLRLLLQAWDNAQALHQDRWDFAVELDVLCAVELTIIDLRWMVHKGFVDHGLEVSNRHDAHRRFEIGGPFLPSKKRCFVLTESGARAVRRQQIIAKSTRKPSVLLPKWDDDRRELWLGDFLVKQFKLPSPNQRTILLTFEEDNWPPRIDDPLPSHPDIHPKRRLNAAISRLNNHQVNRRIRFRGNGNGQGVCWQVIAEPHPESRH